MDKDEGVGDERNPEMKFLDTILTKDFAPCYIHSPFLLADFIENHTLLWFSIFIQKFREARKLEPIHEYHFLEPKNEGEKPDKNSSLRRIKFMHRDLD